MIFFQLSLPTVRINKQKTPRLEEQYKPKHEPRYEPKPKTKNP